jgi:hypothetical protein
VRGGELAGETYVVEVDVDAAEVGEDEIADRVGTLDGVGVVVETVEEPRVFRSNELSRAGVGP